MFTRPLAAGRQNEQAAGVWHAAERWLFRYDIYCITFLALALRMFSRGSSSYGVSGELYRDMTVVYNFIHSHVWPLLGPSSSLGSFNFGAAYYYLLTPLVWLFRGAPYGATAVSALFSVASVPMLYALLRLWFGSRSVARWGSVMLAVSMLDIQYSYYVSNPNLLPFFTLWFWYCLTRLANGNRSWGLVAGAGLALGIATQLHATALLLLPLAGAAVLAVYRRVVPWRRLPVAFAAAALSYVPYALYEWRHGFSNALGVVRLGQANFSWHIKLDSVLSVVSFWQSWLVSRADLFDFVQLRPAWAIAALAGFLVLSVIVIGKKQSVIRLLSPDAAGKHILWAWVAGGSLIFIFFQRGIQQFYFLVLWPAPLVLAAWWLGTLTASRFRAACAVAAAYCLIQAAQWYFFYPRTYAAEFDHGNIVQAFQLIEDQATGHSFNVINGFADVNQFLYYRKLTGADQVMQRFYPERLYIICPAAAPENCRKASLDASFGFPSLLRSRGLLVAEYNRNN